MRTNVIAHGIRSAMFGCVAILLAARVFADTEVIGNITWRYTVKNGEASLGGGSASLTAIPKTTEGEISIPSVLGGFPVTSIGDEAFRDCNFVSSVVIPKCVKTIGEYAFRDCYALSTVTMQEGLLEIGYGAFFSCYGLTSVSVPSTVVTIGGCAFYSCTAISSVTIAQGVRDIGGMAFNDCRGLDAVSIPASVESIGNGVLGSCERLAEICVAEDNKNFCSVDGILYNRAMTEVLQCPAGKKGSVEIPLGVTNIPKDAFHDCVNLTFVSIPQGVTNIERSAFCGCRGLTSISIPPGVASIGLEAFANCTGVRYVSIPSGITIIERSTFRNCAQLATVTIPRGVKKIEGYAFSDCDSLSSAMIPSSVESIGTWAFDYCDELDTIYVDQGDGGRISKLLSAAKFDVSSVSFVEVLPDGKHTEKIGSATWHFDVRNGEATIGSADDWNISAVEPAPVGGLIIPSELGGCRVTGIGGAAFAGFDKIESVVIPEGVRFIAGDGFAGCTALETVAIPSSMSVIGDAAFSGCAKLKTVEIPEGVSVIEHEAFMGCAALTSVSIPSSVTRIGGSAFYWCSSLKSVEIPKGIKDINSYAFTQCSSLEYVKIPASVERIVEGAFSGCEKLNTINVERGDADRISALLVESGFTQKIDLVESCFDGNYTEVIGDYTWYFVVNGGVATLKNWKDQLAGATEPEPSGDLVIPETLGGCPVVSIGRSAFEGCVELEAVTIPASVTNIGEYAFRECFRLTSAIISEGVTSIGYEAFAECVGLESMEIPSSVVSIGDFAFAGLGWTSVTIPEGVMSVGNNVFYACFSLSSISVVEGNAFYSSKEGILYDKTQTTLICCPAGRTGIVAVPDGVTSIGEGAFEYCSGLTSVTIPEGVTSIGYEAFMGCGGLESMEIPSTVTNIGDCAFEECSILTSITISEGVTSIGSGAFAECVGLESVVIPSGVTNIGHHAFMCCFGLTSVTIPESVASVGYDAFKLCDELKTVYVTKGDGDRIKGLLEASGFDNSSVQFVELLPEILPDGEYLEKVADLTWYFTVENGEATIINWQDDYAPAVDPVPERLVVPSTLGGRPVVGIAFDAFSECDVISSVVIPETVRWIGDWAFYECKGLEFVRLPSSLRSIGRGAFCGCSMLSYVEMQEGLKAIGDNAFNGCESLRSISVPSSVSTIGWQAFAFSGLTTIDLPPANIGAYAFAGCECLLHVVIPFGVETIGEGAFSSCRLLRSVVFPQSLTNITDNAFAECAQLASLYFKGNQPTIADYTFPKTSPTCYIRPENVWWDIDESSHWHGLQVVKSLPDGCHEEKVGDYTWSFRIENGEAVICKGKGSGPCGPDEFGYGPAVTPAPVGDLEIPSRLGGCPVVGIAAETLSRWYGAGCEGLTGVVFPEGLVFIGDRAFDNDYSLRTVSFPPSLRKIGQSAFDACLSLRSINLNAGLEEIGDQAFRSAEPGSVCVPDSVLSVGAYAFAYCNSFNPLREIEFGVGVTNIGVGVLEEEWQLSSITVREGNAFYLSENGGLYTADKRMLIAHVGMSSEMTLPKELEVIGEGALQRDMPELSSIVVEEGNANFETVNNMLIDRRTHEVLCGLRTVEGTLVIPEGVVSIAESAFSGACYDEVRFPSTLKLIGADAFSGSALLNFSIPNSVEKIGREAFAWTEWWNVRTWDETTDEELFPGWMIVDGWVLGGAFEYAQNEVAFDEGVKGLSGGVPSDFTDGELRSIKLPKSLRHIGDESFSYCLQLEYLELPEGVISIGDRAFCDSNWGLREVTLPASVKSIGDQAFGWCDWLQVVNMLGDAPVVGEEPFFEGSGSVTLTVLPGSTGWGADGSDELPRTWPAGCEWPATLFCWQTPKPQIVEVVNPSGGGRVVEILSDHESIVFYTVDGSDPLENGMIYSGPIYVDSNMTIRAIARIEGIPDSNVAVKEIDAGTMPDVFDCAAFTPAGSWQKDGVTIKSVTPGPAGHSIMKMRVGGRWAMSFKWRSSTESGFDIGTFSVNGKRVAQISGENGWTRVLCYLDGNGGWDVNSLVWDYHKDGSVDDGEDSIWVSEIKFWEQPVVGDMGQVPLDAFAMDSAWSTTAQGAVVDGNKWNAQTAASSPYGLWMFVEGPVDLSFDWLAPSTVSSDELKLYVDNVDVNSISDIEESQNCVYSLAKTGVHSIEWRYENENDESSGARVENVVLGECSEPAWNYTIYTWEVDGVEFGEVSLEGVYGPCGMSPCVIPEPVGHLVVPETIDGWPVATIEAYAFAGCYRMSSIALPASLWWVDQYAFEGCSSLTNISVYGDAEDQYFVSIDGVLYEQRHNDYLWQTGEEGDHLYLSVFPEGLHPMSFDFPEGVVDSTLWPENLRQVYQLGLPSTFVGFVYGVDGNASFGGWPNLTRIDVADGNPLYYSDDGALYSYRKMYYGMADVPVRLIFWPRNKQPVSLLDTVEEIEQGAFANSDQIEEIALPAGITEISSKSFMGCSSLKRVTVPAGNKVWKSIDGVLYSKRLCICPPGYEGELVMPEGETMQYFDFDHVAKLTGVVFPASCTNVQSGRIFNACSALRTIEFAGLPPSGISWENFVFGSGVDRTKITIRYPSELADGWVSAANELEKLGFVVETSEPPVLTLMPLASSVTENSRSGVSVRLSRTGSTRKPLCVVLEVSTALMRVPTQVLIPAGSASTIFSALPEDNSAVDGHRSAEILARAVGCESGSCEIEIIDDEVPSLSLALSADSLKEGGEKIVVTVTRDLVTNEPLTVYLTGTTANRCSCPKSVTIPAGAASVTFEIEAANDDVARIAAEMTLRASAAGYGSASKTFTVEDDDIPGVTLTLTPDAAQEGGSVRAMVARVDEDDLSKAITVKLSASVPQEIASMPSSVTIPAGKVSVDFNVYLADDGRDNGDRDVVLQGAILIESCGCSGQPSSGDAIEAVLTIIDNDGPTLSLSVSPATMREGLDEAGFLTISHNSVLDEDLTVRISYDLESEIEVVGEVIIRAGEKSVTVPVKTLNDGVEDGSRLVTIAVEDAAGVFAPDTKWLMVTDQNLPDFSAEVDGSVSSVEAGGTFDCRLTIHNSGFADCGRAIPYAVYLLPESERDVTKGVLVSSGSIDGGLAQDALEVRTVANVVAPSNVGHYRLGLVVDPNATITELDEANNTAWSNEIYVGPAYSARAYVALEHFERGAQVMISGSATQISGGKPATKVDVDVYIICDGIRTTLRTKTDAAGQFTVTYQPTSGVCGHCIVGACYPGEGLEDEQDTFDILGLKVTSTSALVWDIALGDENTKTLSVRNPTGVDLTGFTIGNNNLPKGCELTLSAPAKLDAGDSQTFRITAKGTDLTDGVDYEPFEIVLTTAEGATLTHKAYFHCQSQKAYLRARPTSIDTTMTVGKVRTVEVEIYNDGKGDSGPVSVNFKCPDWLRIIGGNIGNLASNESAALTFELAPTLAHGLNYNAVYSGTVGINCENGTGLALPVKFVPVSEEFGSVKVDAIDDNTYHLEGKPHLANAVVKVTNPYTQKIVATGRTDENGLWSAADLPEGKYQLTVTANNHDTYADELLIEPGRTTSVTAFLQYQSIRVSWDVTEVEISDEYDVELTLVYETNVPQPTILTHVDTGLPNKKELPVLEEGQQRMFTITLENVGLIAAKRVTLTMPTIEGYTFTLADNDMMVPAKSSVEIPVLFARPAKRKMLMSNALKATVVKEEIVPCKPKMLTATYWDCDVERSYSYPTELTHNSGLCKKVTYITEPQPQPEPVPSRGGGSVGYGGGISGGTGTTWKNKGCHELEIVDCLEKIKEGFKDKFEEMVAGKKGKQWLDLARSLPKFSEKLFSPSWTRVGKDDIIISSAQYPMEDRKLAELAIDAYDDPNDMTDPEAAGYRRVTVNELQWLKSEKSSWRIDGSSIQMISGLRSMLFVPKNADSLEDASEVVVAYAGTEGSLRDVLADLKNGACVKTQHYDDAAEFLRIVCRHMAGKDVNFAVVGHSLGGGLASYAALANDLSGDTVRIRTYNGVGLCASIMPDSNSEYGCGKSTRNFRTPNDPFSVPGFHNGPTYSIKGDNFSGHPANNFGLRGLVGDDSPSRASKVLWWMSMLPAYLADSANIIMDTVPNPINSLLSDESLYVDTFYCIMGHTAVGKYADALGTAFQKIATTQEGLAGILKNGSLVSTGDPKSDEAISRLLKLDLLFASRATMMSMLLGTYDDKGVVNATTLSKVLSSGSSSLTTQVPSDGSAEWAALESDDYLAISSEIASRLTSGKQGGVTYDTISECRSAMTDPEYAKLFDRILSLAEIMADDQTEDEDVHLNVLSEAVSVAAVVIAEMEELGCTSEYDYIASVFDMLLEANIDGSNDVCASVTLNFNQTVAMTRTAFDGTLTLFNGHSSVPITDVKFEPSVLNENGDECKDLFKLLLGEEEVVGVNGSKLIAGADIAAGGSGSTVVRFVPTHEAAPFEARVYRFGGVVTYTDPFTGQKATVELTPVSLTVEPSPYLKLDYFVQRDVFSDDPDTDEIEPSVPAEIAVLLRNVGAGEAKNVTIDSAQPVMTENEKGLAIDFKLSDFDLEGSCIDGKEAHLGLLSTVNFGTIESGESKIAQWWLTSTLQGHFVDMKATCTPRNKWNTPDTSLVDTEHVDVHKLVRSVSADGDDLPDFLVCDEKDLYGLPDQIITAKGVPLSVRHDGRATISGALAGASPDLLVAVTGSEGWNYVYLPVVGVSGYEVAGVSCDDAELPSRNAWTTDRTFRDAGKPVVEDRLHMLVYFSKAGTKDILVHLNGTAANGPKVEAFEGVTAGAMEYEVRDAVTVVFDRTIDPATLGVADLQLIRQGAYVSDLSAVAIRATDGSNRSFELSGLAAYCSEKGRYELVVQCAGIRSADGQAGSAGKSVSWMLGASGAADSFVVTREVGVAGNVFTFTFSNPSLKLTKEHLKLMKNGAAVGLPPTVSIVNKGLGVYEVTGLDTVLADEGAYSISCDLCAGEAATWSDDLTPPVAAANLRISPDGGIDENDGITYTRELTVTGELSEDGLTVEMLVSYAGAEPTKLADAIVKGRMFSADVVLPTDGNATLVVRSTDAAGNFSDATKDVYVDVIPITATFIGAPAEDVVASKIDLVVSDDLFDGDLNERGFTLTRNGYDVLLAGWLYIDYRSDQAAKANSVGVNGHRDGCRYSLEGLDSVCNEDGIYELRFDSPAVHKRSSGLTQELHASVTWTYKRPDREPPTVASAKIDGTDAETEYEFGFDCVEVPFSEPVNIPELIDNGLIFNAVRTDFAYLPTWNEADNVLTLTVLDERLPRGTGRVVLNPSLIEDLAGHKLNDAEFGWFTGEEHFGEMIQLAKVDSYAMPTWHDGQLTIGYKTMDGKGEAKTGDTIVVSDITGDGCQGVSICWADWDGDGKEELFAGESSGTIVYWEEMPRNKYGMQMRPMIIGFEDMLSFKSSRAVLCAFDADGDGINESIVIGGLDGKFRRIWKHEDGSIGCEWLLDTQNQPIVVSAGRSAPAFADVDHDGHLDLLSGDTNGNVWLYYGTGDAWNATPVCLVSNANGKFPDRSRVAYGDVNTDGVRDLIVGWSDGSVVAFTGERQVVSSVTYLEYEIVWPITLGESLNLPTQTWEVGGAAEWTPEWSDGASDGEHCAFIRNLGNNANAWMQTTVDGPGEISFMWMCDLASKNTKLQFFVDDVAQGVVSGSSPWTPVHVNVYGEGAHVLKWRLFTGRSGAAAADVGAVDAVTWTPAVPPTLAEALNTNLNWTTEGAVAWRGVAKDAKLATRDAWATVTGLGDDATSTVETRVYGSGLLVFDWAVSCEEEYDWLEVSVDDHVYTYITGDVDWVTDGVEIEGEGWHTVRWTYAKDELDDPELAGENKAMLDNVVWLSEDVPPEEPDEPDEPVKTETEATPVPVPLAEIEAKYKSYLDAANGDYEAAAMATGKNGYAIWECYVAGLDPENPDSKFTVQIEIVNGKPLVTWKPALNGTNDDGTCIKEGVRVYELRGSVDLKGWSIVPDKGEGAFNFFKVDVSLPLHK